MGDSVYEERNDQRGGEQHEHSEAAEPMAVSRTAIWVAAK
jgi:hypothetical protein